MKYLIISNKLKNDIRNIKKNDFSKMNHIINEYKSTCKKFKNEINPYLMNIDKHYVKRNKFGKLCLCRYPKISNMDMILKNSKNSPMPMTKSRNITIDKNTLSKLNNIITMKKMH